MDGRQQPAKSKVVRLAAVTRHVRQYQSGKSGRFDIADRLRYLPDAFCFRMAHQSLFLVQQDPRIDVRVIYIGEHFVFGNFGKQVGVIKFVHSLMIPFQAIFRPGHWLQHIAPMGKAEGRHVMCHIALRDNCDTCMPPLLGVSGTPRPLSVSRCCPLQPARWKSSDSSEGYGPQRH